MSFRCTFCRVAVGGQDEFRAHVHTEAHQRKVKESRVNSLVQKTSTLPANATHQCETCCKTFAGVIPYKQHLVSEKHIKKMQALTGANPIEHTPQQGQTNFLFCEPCGKKFAGPVPYQQHIISEKHIKKVRDSGCSPSPEKEGTKSVSLYCPTCEINFANATALAEHTFSKDHRIRTLQANDKSGVGASTTDDKQDRDLLYRIMANHKRDFLVCRADQSFMDFAIENNIFAEPSARKSSR